MLKPTHYLVLALMVSLSLNVMTLVAAPRVDPAIKHVADMTCLQRGGVDRLIPLKSKLVVVVCRDTSVGVLGQKQKREADHVRDNLEAIKF